MKGDPKTIEFLNAALTNELTAINQYFLHSRMLANWGVSKLAKKEYEESIDEMRHADWLIARILFLEGLPNLQRLNKVKVGETLLEVMQADLGTEQEAIPLLKEAIGHCESVQDYVSRDLFVRILASEEEHVDWLETQLEMFEKLGEARFMLLQSEANEQVGPDATGQ